MAGSPEHVEAGDRAAYQELCFYTLAHTDHVTFVHQYVVDAFAAQHADAGTKPITLTFALVGLYLHVEQGRTGRQVQRAHMLLAKKRRHWPKFALPFDRGPVTVRDVIAASPGADRDRAIDCWCASVWRAYAENRQRVSDLVRAELG